ncbi:MAG: LpxI family protein [Pirellula sp.]
MASVPKPSSTEASRSRPSLAIFRPATNSHAAEPHAENLRVGIVAGWGEYPGKVASAVRARGGSVTIAAIRDHASEELHSLADQMKWFGVCKLGAMQRFFAEHNVDQVCLAGKLFKDRILFHGLGWVQHAPDLECVRTMVRPLFSKHGSTTDDTLLGAVVASFERLGMSVVPGTDYATDLIAQTGLLTQCRPTRSVMSDIEFGWDIAKRMGGLDIGQSITVKNRTVLSVEAVEGTDACIERTGILCPMGHWSLVKVAKPQQDMRFDLPTIGPQTIDRMAKAGGRAIAIEAGKTIVIDRTRTLALANRHRIAILSR